MKVGIITFQWSRNYGAALQTFALKQYIESMGHDVSVINYHHSYPKKKSTTIGNLKGFVLNFLLIPDQKKIQQQISRFDSFRKDYYSLHDDVWSSQDLEKLDYDCYVCGSDQIWNPKLTGGKLDPVYFAYCDSTVKRIAYAASIGENETAQSDHDIFREYLKSFSFVSVREAQIVNDISRFTTVPVEHVLDPTLLLNKKKYSEIARNNVAYDEPYLLIYQNTRNNNVYEIAKEIAPRKKLKIVEVGFRRQFPNPGVPIIENAGPLEFLSLYNHASFIVTNTFHGTVFAIQFEKDFYSIPLQGRESRVRNLADILSLNERLVYSFEDCQRTLDSSIDYKSVKERLHMEQIKSYSFLKMALSEE